MAITPETRTTLGVKRRNTTPEVHPYEQVSWERRDAVITDHRTGGDAFRQEGVEFPVSWSQNATNITAQKYFRTYGGKKETSLRQVIDRIADTITDWGTEDGYFETPAEAQAFCAELKFLMLNQHMSFNSPVLFNIGVPGVPQQASACYILSVEDTMKDILNWYVEEGVIFKGGSGAGVNLSRLRSSAESLTGGGKSSGPVTFMRGADASAGTIKSGGTTRRAAKMVILDDRHPDVEQFVWCKAYAERKARVLRDAGYDMDLDGVDAADIPYQNANNSVRVSDEFMQAVLDDGDWELTAVTDPTRVVKTMKARDLFRQINEAAWECADPGLQFDGTINRWHTSPARGRITGSNPCSEYLSNDNTSCNLASINLLKYLNLDGTFDAEGFAHAVQVTFVAQDILVGHGEAPTEKIHEGTQAHRQIGLGYTNLGALLMATGRAYDSDGGRDLAASITALMTGEAYATSAKMASRLGAYPAYSEGDNEPATLRVLGMHRQEVDNRMIGDATTTPIWRQARSAWSRACGGAKEFGVRNSQATLLAPTGTISFFMDADTTSGEPDFSLVKSKKLVGGGTMMIVNQTVPMALSRLGYTEEAVRSIVDHIAEHGTPTGSVIRPEHLSVFACAIGEGAISWQGHVLMMAAIQPFLSGAISKTVNLPAEASVEDLERANIDAWKLGVKCIAIYRDGSKVGQPLSSGTKKSEETVQVDSPIHHPRRRKLSRRRAGGFTQSFRVGETKGYLQVGEYEDGTPGELFLKIAGQGSTMAGILDAFAIQVSHSLQYGEPLRDIVKAHLNTRFEPAGYTDDPDVRTCTSIIDFVVKRLAVDYMDPQERIDLGILTHADKIALAEGTTVEPAAAPQEAPVAVRAPAANHTGQLCDRCGGRLVRSGTCQVCVDCASTSGCS